MTVGTEEAGLTELPQDMREADVAIQVLAGGGIAAALRALAAAFTRDTGHAVALTFGATPELLRMITEGVPFDVGIVPSDLMEDAGARARFDSAAPRGVARVGFAVGFRAGAPRPDVSTPEALRKALVAAASVTTLPRSAAGAHVLAVFERLGLSAALAPKLIAQNAPGDVVAAVADGQAELGGFLLNVLNAPGVEIAGPLPGALQKDFLFVGALAARPSQGDVARAFLAYVTAPDAGAMITAAGLSPA